MLLQKTIETPHRLPKPEELKGRQDVIQEGITAGRLKLAEKPSSVTTDPFPQPQVNMVNLNWLEQKRSRPTTEASSSRGRVVTRETNERPKATISAGVVLYSKCKCETELEVVLDKQNQPTPSVFDRIGTSFRDKARQNDYLRHAQYSKRKIEQPKKEIPIKMPGNEKPLATIIEGRWYSVGKSGRLTLELTRTQKRRKRKKFGSTSSGKTNNLPAAKAVEEQEDWTEEYEEEQLDYEPTADDQNGLLETGEQGDWTEEYGEEHMGYDGELDEETEAFGVELEPVAG
ncbi:unnamed protein product [Prunus armeniaca]